MNPTILVGREKIASEEWKTTCFHDLKKQSKQSAIIVAIL